MIREKILKDFPSWSFEKQLTEYQAYKKFKEYAPFSDMDYILMETVMNNHNASIECKDGVCSITTTSIEEIPLAESNITTSDLEKAIENIYDDKEQTLFDSDQVNDEK